MKRSIGVIGGSRAGGDILQMAEKVGEGIAENGAILVCGGRSGVMEAACRGAKNRGGTTVGILPGDTRDQANRYVDIPIVTGMGVGRNVIVVRSSQVAIAIDGSYGTLSEIAYALQLGIPVIGLRTWEFTDKIQIVETPEEAVGLAVSMLAANE
ncbi:MAG TPA: TIGR00725 family protein [Bacteroidetes bacterium]|nr:TIGR00725 family protein [Bacteroidota bacterium]